MITGPKGLRVDLNTGEIQVMGQSLKLAGITMRTAAGFKEKKFTTGGQFYFDYNDVWRFGALADKNMATTVFEKLFVQNTSDPAYFRPLKLKGMSYQLWEAIPDNYIEPPQE